MASWQHRVSERDGHLGWPNGRLQMIRQIELSCVPLQIRLYQLVLTEKQHSFKLNWKFN